MGRQFTRDFLIEVQKGAISGHSIIHKFGRNSDVPNGTFEGVNELSTLFPHPSAATTVRIKAGGDAADDSGGNGARTITVEGLNDTGAADSEVITTNGVNASTATSKSFWRVFRMFVSTCGTYSAANTADIMLERSAGSLDLINIIAAQGQSEFALYSIPLGTTGYLLGIDVEADAAKAADFRVCTRENLTDTSAPVSPILVKFYFDGVLGQDDHKGRAPMLVLPALTDIWIDAEGGGAATEVSADFEILLVDD